MLKRVKIKGFKSLVDIEVELRPLSVFFGPNAAGKSNFLDALQLLSRIASSPTLKDAFEPSYRGSPLESFTFESYGIEGLLEKELSTFSLEVDVELSQAVINSVNRQIHEMKRTKINDEENHKKTTRVTKKKLRYQIEIQIKPQTGILQVTNEYLAALNDKGEPFKSPRPFLEKKDNRLHLRMEGQAHPFYHELGLHHSILSRPLYPPHYPHIVAMKQELSSWFFFYFEPRERMRAPNPVKEVRHIGLMGEELAAFLNTLRVTNERQFRSIEKSLQLIVPSITGIDVGVDKLGQVKLKLMEGNTPIPASVVSEGTLRILGMLALAGANEPAALIGLEEPENGIHPRRIQLIAEQLKTHAESGDTQIIVTSHSPILLEFLPRESLYSCSKIDGKTTLEPFRDLPLFHNQDICQILDREDESLIMQKFIMRGDLDG
ncbi:MAG: DUF2813 domain-containing protein [Candidatus Omnitrophota bacterium]|jgi:predicted ATPase|nr:MAG: DUF2813 domain-containing protein [Candidatus Omnitrophota bacterium]